MRLLAGVAAVLCLSAAAFAAQPQFWQLEGARDFLEGDTDGLSVDSDGRVRLAPAIRPLHDPEAPFVWSLAASGAYLPATQGTHAHGSLRRFGFALMNVAQRGEGAWSTALIWGANVPTATGKALHSVLFETNLDLDSKNTIFGRAEYSARTAEELDLVGSIDDEIAVGRVGVGVARRVAVISGLTGWLGLRGSVALLPGQLEVFYGSRSPLGFTAYLQVRPPRTP